jgi:hypothetical protein
MPSYPKWLRRLDGRLSKRCTERRLAQHSKNCNSADVRIAATVVIRRRACGNQVPLPVPLAISSPAPFIEFVPPSLLEIRYLSVLAW